MCGIYEKWKRNHIVFNQQNINIYIYIYKWWQNKLSKTQITWANKQKIIT